MRGSLASRSRAYLSEDAGETWAEAPRDFPMVTRDARTGWMTENWDSGAWGYLRDGSIARIDHNTHLQHTLGHDRSQGHMHERFQQEDPEFRWHRYARDGSKAGALDVQGPRTAAGPSVVPVLFPHSGTGRRGHPDGAGVGRPAVRIRAARRHASGRVRKFRFGTFIVRSSDGGRTWKYVAKFDPAEVNPVYGVHDRGVDEGLDEADLAVLPNGDILCVMRADSYAPMFQARSRDSGHTWSEPESTGWQGVKPRLEVLPNGVLACAAGRGGLRPSRRSRT